ncbi:MAG: type II secretion system protein [Dehalococcoidales bacterium]|nr:MAG: type II secretion system protein [Dehalococcoidales bacterium]
MKRGQKGFTLIELLIVVAILGVLAAVVIPNVGRFLGKGEDEAKGTEYATVQAALHAMMVDNDLDTLTGACTYASTNGTATADMSQFPCTDGTYVLYGHTINGTEVNYLATGNASYLYYTTALGTITQVDP